MALIVADRVLETSVTTGTGALALAAAVAGYRRFSSACSVSDTCYYTIEAVDGNGNPTGDYEVGLGTYSATDTLTRTSVAVSSNANVAVNFAAGTKRVWISATAGYLATIRNVRPISFFFTTAPTASEKLMIFVASQTITLDDEFAGSVCSVGTNPTSSFVLTVKKNSVSVGTITISTGGAATFATTGTTVALAIGDRLSVTAPATPDATIADVAITLKGTL